MPAPQDAHLHVHHASSHDCITSKLTVLTVSATYSSEEPFFILKQLKLCGDHANCTLKDVLPSLYLGSSVIFLRQSGHVVSRSNHAPMQRSQNTCPHSKAIGQLKVSWQMGHWLPTASSSAVVGVVPKFYERKYQSIKTPNRYEGSPLSHRILPKLDVRIS